MDGARRVINQREMDGRRLWHAVIKKNAQTIIVEKSGLNQTLVRPKRRMGRF
jgi:hypothetical protein